MDICSLEQNKRAFLGLQHSSHLPFPFWPFHLLFPSFPSQHAPECTFSHFFLQLFLEKYGYFSGPGAGTHSQAEFTEALR